MRKLLLHIGTTKTGTTSIQRAMLAAQRQGALGRVCYPDLLKDTGRVPNPHGLLAYPYRRPPPRRYRSESAKAAIARLMPGFRAELAECFRSHDNIILSTESLMALLPEDAQRFKADLEQYRFDDVAVVIYVRNPAGAYLSSTQQALKASSVVRDPQRYRYLFRRSIAAWDGLFGNRIVVRPFDRALLHRSCVVQDFAKLAADYFSEDMGNVASIDRNVSLSAETMVVLQNYLVSCRNSADSPTRRDVAQLIRILRASRKVIDQTRPRLKPAVEAIVMQRHQDDLNWLREHYGIDFLPKTDAAGAEWIPSNGEPRVDDIVECDPGKVQELLLYALKAALVARKPRRTREHAER